MLKKMYCDFNKEVCWIPKNKTKYTLWNTKYRPNIKYLNCLFFKLLAFFKQLLAFVQTPPPFISPFFTDRSGHLYTG